MKTKTFPLRMNERLYAKLRREAFKKNISLNKHINSLLQSDFKLSKEADCLELEGYKDNN